MSMSAQKLKSKNGGTGRRSIEPRHPARRIAPRWWVVLVFLALLGLLCEPVLAAVDAEEDEDIDPANKLPEGVASPGAGAKRGDDAAGGEEQSADFLKTGKPVIAIDSLFPAHGPVTGDTRVIVRGGPFNVYKDTYTEPKCRFGSDDMVVAAAYVTCPPKQRKIYEKEATKSERTATCIQCENSPASTESKPVEFSVSLTGDFNDVESTAQFYYYEASHLLAIKPHQGPKHGDTTVHIWGSNFQDFGYNITCSFGTRASAHKAIVHSSNYITCRTPPSDVVERAMPVSVSLNGQQQSTVSPSLQNDLKDCRELNPDLSQDPAKAAEGCITFWYYNEPQVTVVEPNLGPETGGNEIELRGDNFKPFQHDEGELDIRNSTFCAFTAFNPPIMTKATVTNSTRARCKAPPSYYWRETNVELTLNAQNYTNDGTKYYYYKPPFLFDVQPAQGPVEGGTTVKVVGSNFNNTEQISCKFGRRKVPGKYLSSSEISCVAPEVPAPGYVDLMISLIPGLYSSPVQYLYYKNPIVTSVVPPSGPESGFTQLVVTGANFVDLGHNSAICVFNKNIHTNATVISETQIICDSPSILNKQGYSELPEGQVVSYVVDVSIDGGLQTSQSTSKFSYYREPKVLGVSPALGPIRGGTNVTVQGSGFKQQGAWRRVVRLGHLEVEPISFTADSMTIETPLVALPSTATVSVSLNGQQFTEQPEVHSPEKSVTFDYYADPYASLFYPSKGPTNGGTQIKVQGYGFMLRRKHLSNHLWARFVDPSSKQELAPASEVPKDQLALDSFSWTTPAVVKAQDVLLQISLNKQNWVDVKDPAGTSSFGFYASPKVTSIDPSYGHVKAEKDVSVDVFGTGFDCGEDKDCDKDDLICRFGNSPSQYIYVKAELVSDTNMRCKVPEYTKPDVLKVEVTVNGESYTSDGRTYGFFDPFVLDAQPRLIATDGSTQVEIKGIGFVDSNEAKAQYTNRTQPIYCAGTAANCVKSATFKDKNTLVTSTFAQADVKYKATDKSVLWDPVYIDATVTKDDEFTANNVEVFYYKDPVLSSSNIQESPANIQSQVLIRTDFKGNDMNRLVRYANPKCRFTSTSGSKVQYTEGKIIAYPFTGNKDPNLVNRVHCKTPRWKLDGEDPEKATLAFSLNGQQFVGAIDFTFLRDLLIHRDIPMSGPQRHASQVKLVGQGYRLHGRDADLKWGVQTTVPIPFAEVQDYTYTQEDFLNTVSGSQELRAYQNEARSFARVDSKLTEGGSYDVVTKNSLTSDDQGSLGGPAYVEVGLDEVLENAVQEAGGDGKTTEKWTLYNYMPSSVEFYAYKEPFVQKVHPTSGLTKGGTFIEVIGTWFRYMPEYGIVPHCRFGDKIARAHFDSSVRLVCQSPPNSDTSAKLPFEVSLNGVDWTNTGIVYSYYDEPIMTDIYPDMGSVLGGDEIYIKGEKFTNNTDPAEFKCRFTPVSLSIPPKTIRARYINSTTIMCPSPGGWSEADQMILQVTWNGVDYDENHFQFTFYSIHRAFPRSGPSNGRGGDIIVSGQGFREDTNPSCMLNHTMYEPVSVSKTEIRCPMPPAEGGDSFFGNVDFAVTANGITWSNFDGGFQYYDQPIVEDIYPKTGPSSGIGIINFYGENFRADYPLAELGCKIGEAKGKAYYVSARQVKCVVEEIPLLAEDEDPLPAQVSLNSYSYTDGTDDTYFRPYGILQLQPASGPTGGVTTVVAQGQGFVAEDGAVPRCRFGTPANYAIVEAEILSYTRLACRSPETLPLTPTSALPRDVPFSIAISGDEYNPWTTTQHKFRFYQQPVIEKVEPEEVELGRIAEVYVTVAEDSEFFDPMPVAPVSMNEEDAESDASAAHPGSLSAIKCKFGRFGEANAVFINATTVKCTTPSADDPPDQIYRETVVLGVAMNGQDFLEESSTTEFTFVGTAPYISFATIVMTLLAVAFVGFAGTLCTSDWYQLGQLQSNQARPGLARGGHGAYREPAGPANFS